LPVSASGINFLGGPLQHAIAEEQRYDGNKWLLWEASLKGAIPKGLDSSGLLNVTKLPGVRQSLGAMDAKNVKGAFG
jgi:hypothetical protein